MILNKKVILFLILISFFEVNSQEWTFRCCLHSNYRCWKWDQWFNDVWSRSNKNVCKGIKRNAFRTL